MSKAMGPIELPLDHNFPEPILDAFDLFMPEVKLMPIRRIHTRLPKLDDRALILTLARLGYSALVTNNYKMLRNPRELAAILHTKVNIVAIEKVGHDPLRAIGGLLLDLPAILRRLDKSKPQAFWIWPRQPRPQDVWDLMTEAANRLKTNPKDLFDDVRVSEQEAETDYLS